MELRSYQENDHDLAVIINWLENGVNPTEGELGLASPAVKHFWIMKDQLFFENNVLYYQWADARFPRKLLVVPQGLNNEILEYFLDHSYGWKAFLCLISLLKRLQWQLLITSFVLLVCH